MWLIKSKSNLTIVNQNTRETRGLAYKITSNNLLTKSNDVIHVPPSRNDRRSVSLFPGLINLKKGKNPSRMDSPSRKYTWT